MNLRPEKEVHTVTSFGFENGPFYMITGAWGQFEVIWGHKIGRKWIILGLYSIKCGYGFNKTWFGGRKVDLSWDSRLTYGTLYPTRFENK